MDYSDKMKEIFFSSDYERLGQSGRIELAMQILDWLRSPATSTEDSDPHMVVAVLRGVIYDIYGDDNE